MLRLRLCTHTDRHRKRRRKKGKPDQRNESVCSWCGEVQMAGREGHLQHRKSTGSKMHSRGLLDKLAVS